MREKYESLGVTELKAVAKHRGLSGLSSMKKDEVIEAMLALDEQEKADKLRAQKESIPSELDSGLEAQGILEVLPEGFGFIRSDNYIILMSWKYFLGFN